MLSKLSKEPGEHVAHLPIIYGRFLGHEFIDAEPALFRRIFQRGTIYEPTQTHISEHKSIHANQIRKLAISLVDLASPSPKARGNAHARKDAVVIQQQTLESFLDEYQVLEEV